MKRAALVSASFVICAVLCFCAMMLNAAGDGMYLPLALCATPTALLIPLLRNNAAVLIGIVLAPFYWSLLGFVATSRLVCRRKIMILLVSVQYLGAVLFELSSGETYDHFTTMLERFLVEFGIFGVIYAASQFLLWHSILQQSFESQDDFWPTKR